MFKKDTIYVDTDVNILLRYIDDIEGYHDFELLYQPSSDLTHYTEMLPIYGAPIINYNIMVTGRCWTYRLDWAIEVIKEYNHETGFNGLKCPNYDYLIGILRGNTLPLKLKTKFIMG